MGKMDALKESDRMLGRLIMALLSASAMTVAVLADAKNGNHSDIPSLHEAVLSYDLQAVRNALAADIPIDSKGFGGATAALVAAQISAWDICLFLLLAGADPAAADEFGDTITKVLAQSQVMPGTTHFDAMQAVSKRLRMLGLH